MRIQAKKIHPGDNYTDIARTNKYGLQIDKLIQDSIKENHFPAYIFYNNGDSGDKCCINAFGSEGIYISAAENINSKFILNGKNIVKEHDIMSLCFALSKLFCLKSVISEIKMNTSHDKIYEEVFKRFFSKIIDKIDGKFDYNSDISDDIVGFKYGAPRFVLDILNERGLDGSLLHIADINHALHCDKMMISDLRNYNKEFPFLIR